MDRRQFLTSTAGPIALAGVALCLTDIAPRLRSQTVANRIGWCSSMLAAAPDGTGIETIELLKELGFDYVELPLTQLMALNDADFKVVARRLQATGLSCEVCNNFLPAGIRATGEDVNVNRNAEYVARALARAARLGASVVVCGSCGSRSLPAGFPREQAWDQMVDFLQSLDKPAADHGIVIAFEAINRSECNFLNLAAEGLRLVKQAGRNHVKLHVDAYHAALENENAGVLLEAGDYVRHVHVANADGRTFPKRANISGYRTFFDNLKRIGYRHRISIEAYSSDLRKDGPESLEFLRSLLA